MKRALGAACLFVFVAVYGCDCRGGALTGVGKEDAGVDAGKPPVDAGPPFDAGPPNCGANSHDLTGCPCGVLDAGRSCYPNTAPPTTLGKGLCVEGIEKCEVVGELATWGPCLGAVTPAPENCTDGQDHNCNNLVGCADPACSSDPTCNMGCDAGDTRSCYDGPAGTENVGICHDGKQTCTVNGGWPADCPGEQVPSGFKENCCGAIDTNCNGFPGCFDFLPPSYCPQTASCCQPPQCSPDAGLTAGCVCPNGSGDTETCPDGTHVVSGRFDECCPCNDCSDINCCGTPACANSSTCNGLTCAPLPPSCNGQVNTDCDDFPEDCDEPCCKCTQCTCGKFNAPCSSDSDCCSSTCNNGSCQ